EEQRRAQADDSIAYLKTQIRELHRRAQVAQEAKEFKKAARLYEQILALNPQDGVARQNLHYVNRQAHIHEMDAKLRRAVENYELAVIGVEESSIVYQDIFRY